MTKREKFLRRLFAGLFAVLFLWLSAPLFFHVLNAGMLYLIPVAFGFVLAAFPAFGEFLFKKHRWLGRTLRILIAVFLAVFVFLIALIAGGCAKPTSPNAETIVVLGCQVRGENPSRMLARRCEAALAFLADHPDATVIATGGLGRTASISEAEAIRRYLVENGIDDGRIYLDEHSKSTEENLLFSSQLLSEHGLSNEIVIVSDRYHQYRAGRIAENYGLVSSPYGCRTEFGLVAVYWCRESLAVLRGLLTGNWAR